MQPEAFVHHIASFKDYFCIPHKEEFLISLFSTHEGKWGEGFFFSVALLYTNGKQTEKEIKGSNTFHNSLK